MTTILYQGTDIRPELPCLGEFARARAAEPITAKPFPHRKPEAKESHAVVCSCAIRACERACVRACS